MKNSSNKTNGQIAGKLWLILIGLLLIMAGSLFVWYLFAVYKKACLMDVWVETPCTIEKSYIDDSDFTQHLSTKFTLVTKYSYRFNNLDYQGTLCKRVQPASGDRKKIEPYLSEYRVGKSSCYVNPQKPSSAVLKKDSKAALYSIWFPGLFVLGGIGIIIATLRKR